MQTVFPISENTGLALTTFHYYTPSGRLIQRNYNNVSLYDYYYVRNDALPADKTNREVKLTDAGRTVYGGGGITPDEKIADLKSNHFQDSLLLRTTRSSTSASTTSPTTRSRSDFVVDDAVMQQFEDFLKRNRSSTPTRTSHENSDWVKSSIKASSSPRSSGRRRV